MQRTGSANMGNDLGRTVSQPAVVSERESSDHKSCSAILTITNTKLELF